MTAAGVIYEVNVSVDANRLAEYDEWLIGHIAQILELPGFIDARTFESVDDDGAALRSVHYKLVDQAALDDYFANHADAMRADGTARFGNAIRATRRILRPLITAGSLRCMNCDATLEGQYCGACGQRHGKRMISVFELLRDVLADTIDWDSRLWRSLRPLLLSPGKLTAEYLNGRRTHYTPPLRMYLVLSVLLFLMTSLPQLVGFDKDELIDMSGSGLNVPSNNEAVKPAPKVGPDSALDTSPDTPTKVADDADATQDDDDEPFDCEELEIDLSLPGLSQEVVENKVRTACQTMYTAEGRKRLTREFFDLIPTLLIIMLPLIALAGKLLYPFSRRYYVEHLLFYTHFHSFGFLFLMVLAITFTVLGRFDWFNGVSGVVQIGAWLYAFYYLFRALRRVFNQGRIATTFKMLLILLVYLIGFWFLAVLGVVLTALSV